MTASDGVTPGYGGNGRSERLTARGRRRRPGVVRTARPLSVPGAAIAAYHSWLQVSQTTCGLGAVSCAQIQYRVLGLTVPNLSLVAFLLATGLVVVASTMRS